MCMFHVLMIFEVRPTIHTSYLGMRCEWWVPAISAVPAITDHTHQHWTSVRDNNQAGARVSLMT